MEIIVHFFGGDKVEVNNDLKNLLNGKGTWFAGKVNLGISIPSGFTITTEKKPYRG